MPSRALGILNNARISSPWALFTMATQREHTIGIYAMLRLCNTIPESSYLYWVIPCIVDRECLEQQPFVQACRGVRGTINSKKVFPLLTPPSVLRPGLAKAITVSDQKILFGWSSEQANHCTAFLICRVYNYWGA